MLPPVRLTVLETDPPLCATVCVVAERLKVPGEFVAVPTVTVVEALADPAGPAQVNV
jgi:hypothetical protein